MSLPYRQVKNLSLLLDACLPQAGGGNFILFLVVSFLLHPSKFYGILYLKEMKE